MLVDYLLVMQPAFLKKTNKPTHTKGVYGFSNRLPLLNERPAKSSLRETDCIHEFFTALQAETPGPEFNINCISINIITFWKNG